MRYRNIKTGIEITTPCAIISPDYEEIEPMKKAEVEVKAPKAPKTVKKVEPLKRSKK